MCTKPEIYNAPILNTMGIFKMVVFSAAEAEFGSRFINTKEATILHATLIKLSHPQLPTPVLVDNCTVDGLANDTIKNSDPVPLTCAFTGHKTMVTRDNSSFTGPQP